MLRAIISLAGMADYDQMIVWDAWVADIDPHARATCGVGQRPHLQNRYRRHGGARVKAFEWRAHLIKASDY
jgi:hypothetical protein